MLVFLARNFSDFAEVLYHLEANAIVSYNIRDVKLGWTVCDDSFDLRLYLAYFMEHYQGNLDINPLYEVNTFPLYLSNSYKLYC